MALGNQRDLAFDRDNGPKQKLLVHSVMDYIMVFGLVGSLNNDRWKNNGILSGRNICVFVV